MNSSRLKGIRPYGVRLSNFPCRKSIFNFFGGSRLSNLTCSEACDEKEHDEKELGKRNYNFEKIYDIYCLIYN